MLCSTGAGIKATPRNKGHGKRASKAATRGRKQEEEKHAQAAGEVLTYDGVVARRHTARPRRRRHGCRATSPRPAHEEGERGRTAQRGGAAANRGVTGRINSTRHRLHPAQITTSARRSARRCHYDYTKTRPRRAATRGTQGIAHACDLPLHARTEGLLGVGPRQDTIGMS